VLLGGGALVLFIALYASRQGQKADVLRQSIIEAYDQKIEPVARKYRTFRGRIEDQVLDLAASDPVDEPVVDERLAISGLHGARGLYLRVREKDATDRDALAAAVRGMEPDAIARCLGLSPTSARTLWERGDFLERDWLDHVRDETSLSRLEVYDDQVNRRYERDLPPVVEAMRADYLLLALVRGDNRRDDPVDVYLWDLRRTKSELLRVHTQARGMLLPVKIAPGGEDLPAPPIQSPGAVDCSIAAQVKAAAGERVMAVGADPSALTDPGNGDDADDGAAEDSEGGGGDDDGGGSGEPAAATGEEPTPAPAAVPPPGTGER